MSFKARIWYLLALCAGPAAAATAPGFDVQPIVLPGATQVAALSLNDHGTIVGVSIDSKGSSQGFSLAHGIASVLPIVSQSCASTCSFIPTAINNTGAIAGVDSLYGQAVVLQGGVFIGAASNSHISGNIGLTNRGVIYFTDLTGVGFQSSWIGKPGAVGILALPGKNPRIVSVNDKGVIAGSGSPGDPVFFGKPAKLSTVPINGSNAGGGYVNDLGQVAGSFIDGFGAPRGFVYTSGIISSFTMPTPAANLQIAGLNLRGRVAGFYTDTTDINHPVQRGFLYNGSAVSTFGAFPIADVLQFALNDNNVILVFDNVGSAASHGEHGIFQSYRVVCRGSAC